MMEIKDNKFYVLEGAESKWIFETENDAISKLKDIDKDPENTMVLEVDVGGDKWSITQVPWSRIAMKLME